MRQRPAEMLKSKSAWVRVAMALVGLAAGHAQASAVLEVKGKVYSIRPDAIVLEISPKMGWVVPKSALDPKTVAALADKMGKDVTLHVDPGKIKTVKLPLEPMDPPDPED